jgi:hypothetical protein
MIRLPASEAEGPAGISDGNRDGNDGSRQQPETAINSQLLSPVCYDLGIRYT